MFKTILFFLTHLIIPTIVLGHSSSDLGIPMPKPDIYHYDYWYQRDPTGALPMAIENGLVSLLIENEENDPKWLDLEYEYQLAMRVWLNSLGFSDVSIKLVDDRNLADVILHIGPEPYYKFDRPVQALHYRAEHEGRTLSFVFVNSIYNKEMISLPNALEKSAKIQILDLNGVVREVLLEEAIQIDKDISLVADGLISKRISGEKGSFVRNGSDHYEIPYWTILHELGHVFGLGDRYHRDGVKVPVERTVMGNQFWRPLTPSNLDISRAKFHIADSGLVPRFSKVYFEQTSCKRLFESIEHL